jgi:hypothetical protein
MKAFGGIIIKQIEENAAKIQIEGYTVSKKRLHCDKYEVLDIDNVATDYSGSLIGKRLSVGDIISVDFEYNYGPTWNDLAKGLHYIRPACITVIHGNIKDKGE